MNDPQMNDILARLNSVGTKPTSSAAKSSNSAGDPAVHDILSRFHAVGRKTAVNEGLGAEQRKVGQLGPTDKPSKRKDHAFKGKLVGEDYNVDEYDQEGEMAKGQLDRAADAAQELHDILDDADNLPEWVQSKITKALDYLDTARDYIKSEFNEDVEGGIDTLTMGIPLFIRMLEYAREEAQTDADLHHVTKKMMDMGGNVTMDDYDEIMSSVGGEESEMEEAVGDKLTDLEYGSATATATPTVGGYHQRRDLETGSYTDYTDRGPISTQTTYDKSGQMTSQHAQARVGDQTMARSRFYPKKNESEELRRLAGLATEDYVGGREAPQDLVKSLSKSYKDFVKEVEQQSAAKPDRELRSKKEKPRKFGNILGEE
jgi:YD repeat-containing protein